MLICQWHLDVPYGKLGEAVAVMKAWGAESLADFEAALAGMPSPEFHGHSDALAPYIVPGSQHWEVFRVLDEHRSP